MDKENLLDYYLKANSIHYYTNSPSEHVFVINESDKFEQNNSKKAIILIPLNERTTIQIPATSLPVDLTEQAPKEDLLKSSHFMYVLSKHFVKICPDDKAFEILSTPAAQKELERRFDVPKESLDSLFDRTKIKVADGAITKQVQDPEINLTVLECLNREDIQANERYTVIKNMENILTKKDWQYIYDHGDEELKTLAADKL